MLVDLRSWLAFAPRPVLMDGGMGTQLAERGWRPPMLPEELNLEAPEIVAAVHRAYREAGAAILETNTFGGTPLKLAAHGQEARAFELNRAGARIARACASGALVAGCMGPIGRLLEPVGDLPFEEARSAYRVQAEGLAAGGADFLLVETQMDLLEAKAAVLGAKEGAPDLPFLISFTFDRNGRTALGDSPEAAAAWAEAVGASATGLNCGVGPEDAEPVVRRLRAVCGLPILAYPNAGSPDRPPLPPEAFAEAAARLVEAGATVVGGCCGTTPAHIRALAERAANLRPPRVAPAGGSRTTFLTSRSRIVPVGPDEPIRIVGERINVSRKGPLREEVLRGNWSAVREEARRQAEAGAPLLDVNVGVAGADQVAAIREAVRAAASTGCPICVDSDRPEVQESALRVLAGVPLLNSVPVKAGPLEEGLARAALHGAALVVLCMDEAGIPEGSAGRLRLAEEAVRAAAEAGLPPERLFVDPLVLTAAASPGAARTACETVAGLRSLGVRTICGASNVSHGLPARGALNRPFLAALAASGLDCALTDPLDGGIRETLAASDVLFGRDPSCARWIGLARSGVVGREGERPSPRREAGDGAHPAPREATGGEASEKSASLPRPEAPPEAPRGALRAAILEGDAVRAGTSARRLLEEEGMPPEALFREVVVPALDEVGALYDGGDYFLPQLVASAEAAQAASREAEARLPEGTGAERETVLLATVEGDLHDLGKKLVGMMLRTRGYRVRDLGKNVPAAEIVEAALAEGAQVVGLSALMSSTAPAMGEVIRLARERGLSSRIIVGGAVVTPEFARSIGSDGTAPDAVAAVRLVDGLLGRS